MPASTEILLFKAGNKEQEARWRYQNLVWCHFCISAIFSNQRVSKLWKKGWRASVVLCLHCNDTLLRIRDTLCKWLMVQHCTWTWLYRVWIFTALETWRCFLSVEPLFKLHLQQPLNKLDEYQNQIFSQANNRLQAYKINERIWSFS